MSVVLCTADTGRQGIEPSLLSTVPITPTDVSVSFIPGSEGGKLLGQRLVDTRILGPVVGRG